MNHTSFLAGALALICASFLVVMTMWTAQGCYAPTGGTLRLENPVRP